MDGFEKRNETFGAVEMTGMHNIPFNLFAIL
jgi:hypothetical protein